MTTEYRRFTDKCNPFVISDFVDFDKNGRAYCPSCSTAHNNKSKTLSLVPNTDGAYRCFRGCDPKDIRAALGQEKSKVIPTALTRVVPPQKVTVDRAKIDSQGILTNLINRHYKLGFEWLAARGIDSKLIARHKLGIARCRIGSKMDYAITIPIPDGQGEYYQKKRVAPWDKKLAQSNDYRPWKQYGIPAMAYFSHKPENATQTWLTEGEWDAIALGELVRNNSQDIAVACFTCGCNAVPSESEFERLPGTVSIFYDRNDKPLVNGDLPGEAGAKKVADALGDRGKIAKVPMPENCQVKGWDVSDAIGHGFIFESFERAATEASVTLEPYLTNFEKGCRTLKQLYDTAPDYVDWLVPDLLTTNELFLLAAEPRAGKSLLALGLAKAIASGGKFLDRPCQQGEVLYICKEDPDDKVKERLIAQEWDEAPMLGVTINNDFTLDDLPELVEYVKQKHPALIVLDTLSRINPHASCENSSEIVDVLAPLQNLAQSQDVCILVVHHTRKKSNVETDVLDIFDSVRGSSAIRATCRGMLVLCKAKDSYRLAVENGRTAVQDLRVHLNVANLTWLLKGYWTPPSVNLTQKEQVSAWMHKHLQGKVADVSQGTLIPAKNVSNILNKLSYEAVLKRGREKYNAMYYINPNHSIHSNHQGESEVNLLKADHQSDRANFHQLSPNPQKSDQSDQLCNELLSSDHFDQKIEGNSNLGELKSEGTQCTIISRDTSIHHSFTSNSSDELKVEKVISPDCSQNFCEPGGDRTTNRANEPEHNIVNVVSLSEFQALEGKIDGFWHNTHGYLKFVGFEGHRILGRENGMQKVIKTLWRGCTGQVELKKQEDE